MRDGEDNSREGHMEGERSDIGRKGRDGGEGDIYIGRDVKERYMNREDGEKRGRYKERRGSDKGRDVWREERERYGAI